MQTNKAFVISKNGKLLSSLFCDPYAFEASKPRDAYVYINEQIAKDIATKQNAKLIEVYKPNFPFGDWEFKPNETKVCLCQS